MISKILFHLYAIAALSLFGLFVYDEIAYNHVMFEIAKAQASALIVLVQKFVGA